jgi:GNAT superfamily N-acetyltransferase
VDIEIAGGNADDVGRILGLLPDWFGIPEAVVGYVEFARSHPVTAALSEGRVVGVLMLQRHTEASAEIHLMAVEPGLHRKGIGSALVDAAEQDLIADGVRLLEVKTLGPSYPDEHYARTRAFYAARGFLPMEELLDFWPGNPALILVKPAASSSVSSSLATGVPEAAAVRVGSEHATARGRRPGRASV